MSLFHLKFSRIDRFGASASTSQQPPVVPHHMPTVKESGLGAVQYESNMNSVAKLADSERRGWGLCGSYIHYSPKDKARIGKHALENGNINAICLFRKEFHSLKESTLCNFKKAYKAHLDEQRKKSNLRPVTKILSLPRGRPPLLLEADEILVVFLKGIHTRG